MDRDVTEDRKNVSPNDMQPNPDGEQAKEELDQIPPPGTDPLHEGP